ncbi:autotransporter outer membrane beta-barrel domain-containing protein [Sphingomonas edaphi]|uniref:Autotransporter domain-containing protein n=1 Tax=Sphingomonas edaphi TaxID=2315689 RepID=A0A418Q2G2_9SPHN|nr:autotransporter outer membrane beta-barrel domain-containing protein [Sphingomonas edaphi]RIX32024.1 autotransporter domain-containing protein [Sphingomonas edaphi]
MRYLLFASTCLAALASPLAAETTISTAVTGTVRTSTVKAGTPDDISITSSGSVTSSGPSAIIIDSNNKLTNAGTIQIGNVLGAVGIEVLGGVTGAITNSGKIIVDEPYAPTDADNDGDLDGPFATGSNRFGIRTTGAFTGNIVNSGTVTVEGNNSGGIVVGGSLTGNFRHDGTTTVLGNNSVGISLADVAGSVRLAGTINVQGQGSTAVRSTGDVTGSMVIQGKIAATGYRYSQSPSDPSKLDADDLLQGGPAVSIEGDVANGIILAVAPKDQSASDNDEDDDGIEDAKEGSAAVVSYGAAPAMRIGSANAVDIGATSGTGTGFGLIIDGVISGEGVYTGVDGNGLQIGGMGGAVAIANGIGVSGAIQAKSLDRSATAVRIGSGTSTPELRNAGKLLASSGNTAQSNATAVDIAAGASLPILRNSGEIKAGVSGPTGSATAIIDRSGTLALVENSGSISAIGAEAASTRNVAIDMSANSSGAMIRQTAVAATFAAPSIVGDIRFGTGSDTLDVADGTLTSNVTFGAGNNGFLLSGDAKAAGKLTFGNGSDAISTSGTAIFAGSVDFGGGADMLSIAGTSSFTGQLSNASGLAVSVQKGTFGVVKAASIASLSVTDGGTIGLLLDKTAGASSSLTVSGNAVFGANSKLQLTVANVAQAEGHYVVIDAGGLTGGSNLTANTTLLPFLYKGSLMVTGNQVAVDIVRKSAAELGLNRSESAAYAAVYNAIGTDAAVGGSFLAIEDQAGFIASLQQMLPDHAGGTFEAVTMGERTAARMLNDPAGPHNVDGGVNVWATQLAWGSSKSVGDTAGYKIGGWGVAGGADFATPLGRLGASISYMWGKDDDRSTDNTVNANQYSLAGYWHVRRGGLQAVARASYSFIDFDGTRYFRSIEGPTPVERKMEGSWTGSLFSASANASQELWAGSFFVRPSAGVEYYRLNEGSYTEKGGGTALDLTVAKRKSDEFAANALIAAGFEFGGERAGDSYFRLEAEAGRRQILGGSLGNTTAHFANGDPFVLEPEDRESGWVGRLRGIGGSPGFRLSGEVGAEEREDRVGISARASLVLGL